MIYVLLDKMTSLSFKVVPGGCHDKIFGVKFETVKMIGGR